MIIHNYNNFIKEVKKTSNKIFFIDGPRRCSTNYTRSCFYFMTLNKNSIVFIMGPTPHDPVMYSIDGKYLHNKNVIHIVPLRKIFPAIVSSLIMRDKNFIELSDNKLYLFNEIYNFMLYFNLNKIYTNVINVPLEIFNNNEEKIFNLLVNKNNVETKTAKFNKDDVIKNLEKANQLGYGADFYLRYHSYPIEEQNSEEYQLTKNLVENFVNKNAKELIDTISKKYEIMLEEKRKEWNILN
jgi:hypothetical protein